MNAWEFLSTPEKERVLRLLLYLSEEKSIRGIAREAKVSPAQVHKYLAIWKKHKLTEGKKLKDNPFVQALRLMENLLCLDNYGIVELVRKKLAAVRGVGLYGSWAKGTNDEKADIDIWILVDSEPSNLAVGKLRQVLQKTTGKNFYLTVLNKEKCSRLKNANPTFYYSLVNSMKLWGNELWSI